jgi:hypothetical protein
MILPWGGSDLHHAITHCPSGRVLSTLPIAMGDRPIRYATAHDSRVALVLGGTTPCTGSTAHPPLPILGAIGMHPPRYFCGGPYPLGPRCTRRCLRILHPRANACPECGPLVVVPWTPTLLCVCSGSRPDDRGVRVACAGLPAVPPLVHARVFPLLHIAFRSDSAVAPVPGSDRELKPIIVGSVAG